MYTLRMFVLSLVLVEACRTGEALGQAPAPEADRQLATRRFEYFKTQARDFRANMASGQPVELAGGSILNWTLGSSWHGGFYIWTSRGRPVLVGCFLADSQSSDIRRSMAEFHVMTDERIEPIVFDGLRNYRWTPDPKDALVLPTQMPVTGDARTRLRDMRALARELAVTMYSDDEKSREELRLLTQPLYRFPEGTGGADGAIFGYVTTRGTDPEFLLAVETPRDGAKGEWRLRPMRSCTRRLDLRRESETLWSADAYDLSRDRIERGEPYVIVPLAETDTPSFERMVDLAIKSPATKATP